MARQWEMEFGMGVGMPAGFGSAAAPAYIYGMPAAAETTLRVDELLDFSHHDLFASSSSSSSAAAEANLLPAAQFAAGHVSNSEYHYPRHASFADDIYIPSDEVAELEWLSKFVEDSFSDVPVQSLAAETTLPNTTVHRADVSNVVRGARSKRSRGVLTVVESVDANHHAASAWSSLTPSSSTTSSSSSSDFPMTKGSSRKKLVTGETVADGGGVRQCTHCASEKTPQWRTGPLGPKTLCNACGVRFKSGRLVPEYRPAASPTFVLTQHSNSHRKVMELRRQKELLILRRHDNASSSATFPSAAVSTAGTEMIYHDYDVY